MPPRSPDAGWPDSRMLIGATAAVPYLERPHVLRRDGRAGEQFEIMIALLDVPSWMGTPEGSLAGSRRSADPSNASSRTSSRKCADPLSQSAHDADETPDMTPPGDYPRDMVGYGPHPPDPRWPGRANIAVQFVLNYEEGGENNVLDGDESSETFLSEIVGAQAFPNRHMSMESLYEYGSRAGLWRVLRVFDRHGLPLTIFGVATALARNPEALAAFQARGDEIACHGLSWRNYQLVDPETERRDLAEAVRVMTELTGAPPLGWYTGRDSPQTRRLVVEHGGFLYDSDSYADDLPYWTRVDGTDHLVVPYTLDTNDMKFVSASGFPSGTDFFSYLRDAFDVLYAEGAAGAPKMLSIGLHCRLVGRPARIAALERFLDHVQSHDGVWIARRIEIARHWAENFPP